MLLREKIEFIAEKDLNAFAASCHSVAMADLASVPHKGNAALNSRYFFEPFSRLDSPWIRPNAPAFFRGFIGAHSYVNDGGYLRESVLIGRYCSIGRRATIGAGMHYTAGLTTSPAIKNEIARPYTDEELTEIHSLNVSRPTTTFLENDVWIGDGVVIVSGVRLATGTVVGANAVVTKNTEPYGIYAGQPAQLVKKRFSEKVIARLLKSEWWEQPYEAIRSLPQRNVFDCLEYIEAMTAPDDSSGYCPTYVAMSDSITR